MDEWSFLVWNYVWWCTYLHKSLCLCTMYTQIWYFCILTTKGQFLDQKHLAKSKSVRESLVSIWIGYLDEFWCLCDIDIVELWFEMVIWLWRFGIKIKYPVNMTKMCIYMMLMVSGGMINMLDDLFEYGIEVCLFDVKIMLKDVGNKLDLFLVWKSDKNNQELSPRYVWTTITRTRMVMHWHRLRLCTQVNDHTKDMYDHLSSRIGTPIYDKWS